MESHNCYTCGKSLKHVPAGVSKKTGRPYDAFWSCPNNCKEKFVPTGVASRQIKKEIEQKVNSSLPTSQDKVLEAISVLSKKVDGLLSFMQENLGTPEQ